MSWSVKTREVVVLAVALAGGGSGRTQPLEPSVPAPGPPAAGSTDQAASIAGAKKDFAAVKSLRSLGEEAKSVTPRVLIPNMQSEATPPFLASKRNGPENQLRTSNWLVDAMEKSKSAKGSRGTEVHFTDAAALDQRKERHERSPARFEKEGSEREAPANPFSRYLGDWISPQDYALLKPALGPSGSTQDFRVRTAAGGIPLASASLPSETGVKPRAGTRAPVAQGGSSSADRVNPYLELVKSPVLTPLTGLGAAKPKVATASPQPTGGVTPSMEPPPVAPRPKAPDLLRPNPDDKYFKQLKRF